MELKEPGRELTSVPALISPVGASSAETVCAEAGVREYWIVDPSMKRTMLTRFEEDPAPRFYPFDVPIAVGVLPGLSVSLADIMARL